MTAPELSVEDAPSEADRAVVETSLRAFNRDRAGASGQPLAVLVRQDGEVLGGLLGYTFGGWLFVSMLWLDETLRGRGLGEAMIAAAEERARRRGCTDAWLDTFSFQAPGFYRRLGYESFAELPHVGFTRHFFRKTLV